MFFFTVSSGAMAILAIVSVALACWLVWKIGRHLPLSFSVSAILILVITGVLFMFLIQLYFYLKMLVFLGAFVLVAAAAIHFLSKHTRGVWKGGKVNP